MNRILKSLILLPWLLAAAGLTLHAQSVTVNWTKTHQTIDGFGASTADEEDPTDPIRNRAHDRATKHNCFSR